MPYIGKQPASVPVTADDIPNDSITAAKIVDAAITIADIGPNAVGSSEMADDAVGLNELSATGTTNSSTFLRGDNTWAVPPDNNTTYSVQDGQLSQNNFTDADHSKLNAIEASADVTDATNVTAAGALMDSEVTNLAQVKAFDSSDYATAAQGTLATNALPKAGGTMTGTIAGFTSTGIDDNADATAMTITSDENIGIGTTTPPERLSIHEPSTGTGTYLPVAITGANYATGYGVGISFKTENTSPTQKAKAAIIAEGTGEGYNKTSLHIAMSNTNDTTTEVALANSVLEFTMDGRGLSQFTAKAWVSFNGTGTVAIRDSHNVSSITDLDIGYYRVNYSNNMANANYAPLLTSSYVGSSYNVTAAMSSEPATSQVNILVFIEGGSFQDIAICSVAVFGD